MIFKNTHTHMNNRLETVGALAFALIAVTISGTAVHNAFSPEEIALVPTLDGYSILGQSVPSHPTEIHDYSPEEAAEGVTLYADSHNFFSCRSGGITFITTTSTSVGVRFWAYEFTGNEPPFNGNFYVSDKELEVNPELNGLPKFERLSELKRYYVMTEQDLSFTCGESITSKAYCGDNICQENENADSCLVDCNACGDGQVHGDEECDDGNSTPNDGCTQCLNDFCNDTDETDAFPGGIGNFETKGTMEGAGGGGGIYTGTDNCINENTLMEFGCLEGTRTNVTNATCANGCEDGACRPGVCGDGVVGGSEECDNYNDGPGCSDSCEIEIGYSCEGEPSECQLLIPTLPGGGGGSSSGNNPVCNDTDRGDDFFTKGTATIGGQSGTDNCSTSTTLNEYSCQYGFLERLTYSCEFSCDDGACTRGGDNGGPGPGSPGTPADAVSLLSAEITGGNELVLAYSKNFNTCAHIYKDNRYFNQRINFICGTGEDLEARANQSDFNDTLSVGDRIKICHGNNGDLCSNYVTVTDGTISSGPSVDIAQQETGSSNSAVENQKDITLLRFQANANGEDLLITQAQVEAAQGDLRDVQNYTFWVDTDGDGTVDTILEDGVATDGSRVTFNDMAGGGYVLPEDESIVFEVHGDVASSISGGPIQLRFEIGLDGYIEMEKLRDGSNLNGIQTDDGECRGATGPECSISVTTADSTIWSFASMGSLFVTKDSTPLRHRQLLGGTLAEAILRLEFHAEDEDIDVTDIQLSANTQVNSIDRLELYFDGQSRKFAEATKGGCGSDSKPSTTTFCANMEGQQLVIPSGQDIDVIVRPRMKTDEQGGVSGEEFSLAVNGEAIATFNAGSIRARGLTSSNNLVANNGDNTANGEIFIGTEVPGSNSTITGNMSQTVLAKVSAITNANPYANGTAVPTGVSPIGQFKFSAAGHNNSKNGDNDVLIKTIRFDVNGTNVAINASSFKFYNKADQTVTHSCQPFYIGGQPFTSDNISGVYTVLCTGIDSSAVDSEIDDGRDITLVLQADIVSPNIAASNGGVSVLQTALTNFSDYGTDSDHIIWSDKDQSTNQTSNWIEYPETTVKSTSYNS